MAGWERRHNCICFFYMDLWGFKGHQWFVWVYRIITLCYILQLPVYPVCVLMYWFCPSQSLWQIMPYCCDPDLHYRKPIQPTVLSLSKARTVCIIRRQQPTYERHEKGEMRLYNNGQLTRRISTTTEKAGQADISKAHHPCWWIPGVWGYHACIGYVGAQGFCRTRQLMNDVAEKQGAGDICWQGTFTASAVHYKPMGGSVYCIGTSLCGTQQGQEENGSTKNIPSCSIKFLLPRSCWSLC